MDNDGKFVGKWSKTRNKDNKPSQKLISWEWFKSYILKNGTIRMEQNPWTKIEKRYFPSFAQSRNGQKTFYQYMKQFWNENLDPNLPFQIVDDEFGGVKVISKSNDFGDIQEKLIGHLESPPANIVEKLHKENFSSFFLSTNKIVTVMFGPLSLVNHECKSNTGFTTTRNGNYYKVLLKPKFNKNGNIFPIGEEIVATYCEKKEELGFICQCKICIQ